MPDYDWSQLTRAQPVQLPLPLEGDLGTLPAEQQVALAILKSRVEKEPVEEFSDKELARLRFMRWLVNQGCLDEDLHGCVTNTPQ